MNLLSKKPTIKKTIKYKQKNQDPTSNPSSPLIPSAKSLPIFIPIY
jgi:hypothetical protein